MAKQSQPLVKQMVEERPEEFAPKLSKSYLDKFGRELPSHIPMAPPIGFKRRDPIHIQIKRMVQSELLAREAAAGGFETPDEADDFNVGDDYDPSSPYEHNFEPPEDQGPELRDVFRQAVAEGVRDAQREPHDPEDDQGRRVSPAPARAGHEPRQTPPQPQPGRREGGQQDHTSDEEGPAQTPSRSSWLKGPNANSRKK